MRERAGGQGARSRDLGGQSAETKGRASGCRKAGRTERKRLVVPLAKNLLYRRNCVSPEKAKFQRLGRKKRKFTKHVSWCIVIASAGKTLEAIVGNQAQVNYSCATCNSNHKSQSKDVYTL